MKTGKPVHDIEGKPMTWANGTPITTDSWSEDYWPEEEALEVKKECPPKGKRKRTGQSKLDC